MSRQSDRSDPALPLGSQRLLHWLARYPFQRLCDLEVALAPWHSRASIARFLAALLADGFIEAILPGIAQGKRLYHLSHRGALWLAESIGSTETPPAQMEREKLARLLPRLPVWLLLPDCVNGLVKDAAVALTRQGRRATLVRWDWQRDYTRRFFSQGRKRPLSVQVDGALALCLRYETRWPSEEPQEVCYHLLLLRCLLDDARLLRQRLERIARWRESAERGPIYSQMPPVLLLATTTRQAERWHLMSEYVIEALHLNQMQGAVACFPSEHEESLSPWRLAWRTLETNRPCHLQDLLVPSTRPLLPGLADTPQHEAPHEDPRSQRLPQRNPYDLARRAESIPPSSGDFLAAFHLTLLQWTTLLLLYAHPLVNKTEIATFSGCASTSLEKGLADLQRRGYVEARKILEVRAKGKASKRWVLTERGLSLLAASANWHVLRLARRQAPHGPLQQRGLAGLLHQLPHTLGIYGFFTCLAALPGHLCWWESGSSCVRQFRWKGRQYSFQPDDCAEYQLPGHPPFRFWLEWDQGTMNVRDLTRKFENYAAYLDSHEWSRAHRLLPLMLCVVPDIDQERRVSRCAREILLDAKLLLSTTTRELLHSRGLDAPIWRQVILQATRSPADGGRFAVFAAGEDSAE